MKFRSDPESMGLLYGFLGVLSFSLTLPATRVAVIEFEPIFVGLGRGFVAAAFAAVALGLTRQPLPDSKHLRSLAIVSAGVVIGFPWLSAWAMQYLPAVHGAVVLGLLPLATALAGVVRAGERPSRGFWVASCIGSVTVISYTLVDGAGRIQLADLVLLGAVVAAAFGYAEGGRLAQTLGGWQVISWALVLAVPVEIAPMSIILLRQDLTASPTAWLGFGYVCLVSQFLGFFVWYRGLAIAGVARVSQLQLLQPFLTVVASAILLGEKITLLTIGAACIVVVSVAVGRRTRIERSDRSITKDGGRRNP